MIFSRKYALQEMRFGNGGAKVNLPRVRGIEAVDLDCCHRGFNRDNRADLRF